MKLSRLSQSISATIQEASRHAGRLSEAGLIKRDGDGYYHITTFGEVVLAFLNPLRFLSGNQDYFLVHNLSILPMEFLERIGELSEYEYREGVSGVLRHIEEVILGAKSYIWLMSDQAVISAPSLIQALSARDIPIKMIAPLGKIKQQQDYQHAMVDLGRKLELRVSATVQVGLALNEHAAGVCFPDLSGKIDFNRGFKSLGPGFLKWCQDLFQFFWQQAKAYQ